MCCVTLSTNVGFIYVFNVYFLCDNSTQCKLQLYNEMLATLSSFFIKHNVVNCITGGDLNTVLSRVRSGNTISLNNFILREMLFIAQQVHINNINTHLRDSISVVQLLIILFYLKTWKCLLKNSMQQILLVTYLITFHCIYRLSVILQNLRMIIMIHSKKSLSRT